jgi:hypothetical protein
MEDSSTGMPRLLLVPGPVAGAVRLRAAREVSPTSSADDFQWESRQGQRLAATRRAGQRLAERGRFHGDGGHPHPVGSVQGGPFAPVDAVWAGAGSVHYTRLSRPRWKERQQRKEREAIKEVKRGAGHARNEATD